MSRADKIPTGHVALEVDGQDVSTENIDAPAVLEIAAAFFSLLQGNAHEEHTPLSLKGIKVIDKCVAIASGTDKPDLSRLLALKTHMQIEGKIMTPRGLTSLRDRARAAIKKMPELSVTLIADNWSAPILLPVLKIEPIDSMLSIRATVIRVTGEPYSRVRLKSRLERKRFSLSITKQQAQDIGKHLLAEVDIDARIRRDTEGNIVSGRLTTFQPVDTEGDPIAQWKSWFKEVGANWNDIADIESELKR